jgi:Mg-chelatase subunit ChlD
VRAAIAHTLFVTTGMNLYDFAETWARWWVEHGGSFEVPTEIPKRRKVDAGGTVASFYGLPLDSGRVAFVIDRSGSMSALDQSDRSRLETAVSETLGAVGRLEARDRVNVILFDNLVRAWQKRLVPLTPSNRAQLEAHLRRQEPTGATNLFDALEAALTDQQVDTVFLLSDGAPSAGKFTVPADVLRAVGRLNQARRIAIHCVSVGRDSDLLKKLAAANGGKYVRR